MKQKLILCCVSLIALIWACLPPAQENLNDLKYALNDQVYQDIKNFQDRRLTDSLVYFLINPKAVYRMLSAEALGSYRDTNAIQELIKLLKDPNESVKQAAIFSLGQIGHQSAERPLINSFIAVDSTGPYLETNVMILEALGKCGTDSTLNLICKIQNYQKSSQTLLEGQMLCLYRFGLRNKICPASTALLVQVATTKSNSESARLIASHCLLRFKELNIKPHYKELRNACFEEKNASIRMCLIAAFARITTPETLSDLEELYTRIFDNRIQCNLVRGLQNFPNGMASSLAKKALQNPSSQVASLAAEYFLKNSGPNDEKDLQQILNEGKLPWNSKSQIYASLIKLIPIHKPLKREVLFTHLLADINNSKSAYEKSAYIIALQNSPSYLSFLLQLGQKEKDPYTLTTLTQTIAHIYKNPTFPLLYKGSLNPIYNKTNFFLAKACQNYDVGSLAIISEWFRTEKGLIRKYFKPDSSLRLAQKGLKLPRDIETYNEIENTLSVLNNKKFRSKNIEYNHPIQWKRLTNIHDTIHAEIICTKGKIEIELYPKLVPGSVTNFLELVDQNFFNGKIIHRVVPNFVIQVGCPRGDGYGSLDYSIRTETNTTLNYQKEGMIGMASAGLDTECSQFFITFSPTPHLDGKYTIFGKMTKGMDVMMLIEQGDKILKINLME